MQDIKRGEVVVPTTPIRRKKLGIGVVVSTNNTGSAQLEVVFPAPGGFVVHYFAEDHLERAEDRCASCEEVMQNTLKMYEDVMIDSRRA